jgi:hypothetical protein
MFVGYFFKETIILSGILYFFTGLPKWHKVRYLVATGVIAFIMKVGITLVVDGKISLVTNQFIGGHSANALKNTQVFINLKELTTPTLNHFIFTNGGTLIISLLLPMRTQMERGTKAVIVIFSLAALMAGAVNEYRIMLDILPISILAVREYLLNPQPNIAPAQIPDKKPPSKNEQKDRAAHSQNSASGGKK